MKGAGEKLVEARLGKTVPDLLQESAAAEADVLTVADLAGVTPQTVKNWVRRAGGTVETIHKQVIRLPEGGVSGR